MPNRLVHLQNQLLACIAATVALAAPLLAQTVRPVIVQYSGSARGKFELVNNAFQPTNVVIEPRSFTINEDGDGVYGPLANNIHVKLSAMSLRIPPKQSRFVFYEAKADTLPAWFVLYSVFARGRPKSCRSQTMPATRRPWLRKKSNRFVWAGCASSWRRA